MGASLRLGRPFGIAISIHWSFWFVVLWAGSEGARWSGRWQGAAFAVSAILLFFLCILLHELGHAVVARLLGLEVKGITLLPFGGLAQIHNMSGKGYQEFAVALAGPMVNFLLALALGVGFIAAWGTGLAVGFSQSSATVFSGIMGSIFNGGGVMSLVSFLILTNFLLFAFNLLPAFPMDGGRLLRAFMAMWMPYQHATRIAVRTGQALAVLAIVLTLTPYFGFQSPGAVFIAVFVFVGATYEDRLVQARWRLNRIQVADVMYAANLIVISPEDLLGSVMERIFKAPHFDLPVMVQGALTGMLCRDDLLLALRRGESQLPVRTVMRTDYPSLRPTDDLHTAQEQMLSSKLTTLPVLQNDVLVGLINIRHLKGAMSG